MIAVILLFYVFEFDDECFVVGCAPVGAANAASAGNNLFAASYVCVTIVEYDVCEWECLHGVAGFTNIAAIILNTLI